MSRLNLNGADIYYEIQGHGETIVLLHNGFSCTLMWEHICPRLVSAGYRVLMYDRRGFGRSDGGLDFAADYVDEHYRQRRVEEMASILAALDVDRCHIVGQCEGGVIGVDYTVTYPDQVITLTTASTMCHSLVSMETFNRLKMTASFDELDPDLRQKYHRWHGVERGQPFYDICVKGGGCYGQSGFFDLRPVLSTVARPTLVMYPDRGYFFDVEQGVTFYRHLVDAELLVFPKCGHNIFEHYPAMYAGQVAAFIQRHEIRG